MSNYVMIVDDDENLLSAMKRQLRTRFAVTTADGGERALALIQSRNPPAVVLCDMRMRGMNGIETLRKVKEVAPDAVRMMLTGNADMQTAIDAINDGNIFRFLTKPCPPDILEAGLNAAMEQHRLIIAERELLEKTLAGSVKVLMDTLAMASPEGYGRATRIRGWVRQLTAAFNMPMRWQLDLAAMLAPLGTISIPAEILAKVQAKAELTEVEQAIVERSPEAARNVITNIPRLGPVAQIVYLQNKGYDGSGFPPDGPTGGDIPIDARILKILNDLSDVCESTTPSKSHFAKLEAHPGRYDPTLFKRVRSCLEVPDDVVEAALPTKTIPSDLLRPGMTLATDVIAQGGRLVLASMVQISAAHVERLRNLAKLKYIPDSVTILNQDEPKEVGG